MGLAIQTLVATATNPGAAGAVPALVSGDSANVRTFNPSSKAYLDFLSRQGATAGFVQVASPLFHDAVRGLRFFESESPAVELLPQYIGQPLRPGDALQLQISGGAAEVDAMALGIYYQDLPGSAAAIHAWTDISAQVLNIKPVQVAVTTNATAGVWQDTLITVTENLLKSDRWYALLGYTVDVACLAVGLLGPATGNLRVAGPGTTTTLRTDDYFLRMDRLHGRPYIPTFNGNDRTATFCSVSAVATAAAINVELVLAELDPSFHG